MSNEYILEMEHISKRFPGVVALDDVQLKVRKGTVHALMGENGAGKSTLMKILIGINKLDSGNIIIDGKEVQIQNTHFALKHGISMIFQELSPIPHMTVMENIYVGREQLSANKILISKKKMAEDTAKILKKLEMESINPKEKMVNLSVAKTQMVEICKAISYNSKLIIMDEPTSAISEKECDHLFKIVKQLTQEGVSFIFITHKMDEVFKLADDITVFRDGKFICTEPASNMNHHKLVEKMVGREITQMFPKEEVDIGDVYLSFRNLTKKGLFENVSFDVRRGEIVGLAGLMGAGRTELMETIFGYRKLDSGEIYIDNKKVTIKSPKDAIANRMALLTEDRKLTGLYLPLTVKDNMIMPSLRRFSRSLLLQHRLIAKVCNENRVSFEIKTPSINQIVNNLSGGNQQKVLIARWLMTDPEVIILDEPTRGIDVGSKSEIHKLISSLAKQGKCIIMISSEMPEVIGMSDRIVVMYKGTVKAIIDRCNVTQELILENASGLET
jgi:inositol transport system ATP-binding protein